MQILKNTQIYAPKQASGKPSFSYFPITNIFNAVTISSSLYFSFSGITINSKENGCNAWFCPYTCKLQEVQITIDDTALTSGTLEVVSENSGVIGSNAIVGGTGMVTIQIDIDATINSEEWVSIWMNDRVGSYDLYSVTGVFYFT